MDSLASRAVARERILLARGCDPSGKSFLDILGGFIAGLIIALPAAIFSVLAAGPAGIPLAIGLLVGGAIGGAIGVVNNDGVFNWQKVFNGAVAGMTIAGLGAAVIGSETRKEPANGTPSLAIAQTGSPSTGDTNLIPVTEDTSVSLSNPLFAGRGLWPAAFFPGVI